MATVTGLTAERTLEIENSMIVAATINGSGHLILTREDGDTIDAGIARGATGSAGQSGAIVVSSLEAVPPGTTPGTPVFLRA